MKRLLLGVGALFIMLSGLFGPTACSPPDAYCIPGTPIGKQTLNPDQSPCQSDCECNNYNFAGRCLHNKCASIKRSECDAPGEVGLCVHHIDQCDGKRTCQPSYLSSTLWGDCICPSQEPPTEPTTKQDEPQGKEPQGKEPQSNEPQDKEPQSKEPQQEQNTKEKTPPDTVEPNTTETAEEPGLPEYVDAGQEPGIVEQLPEESYNPEEPSSQERLPETVPEKPYQPPTPAQCPPLTRNAVVGSSTQPPDKQAAVYTSPTKQIYARYRDNRLDILYITQGGVNQYRKVFSDDIDALAISPDGVELTVSLLKSTTSSRKHELHVFEITQTALKFRIKTYINNNYYGRVTMLAYSPAKTGANQLVIVGVTSKKLFPIGIRNYGSWKLADLANGGWGRVQIQSNETIRAIQYAKNGLVLAIQTNTSVKLYPIDSKLSSPTSAPIVLNVNADHIALNNDGRRLALVPNTQVAIDIYETSGTTSTKKSTFKPSSTITNIHSLTYSHDGQTLLAAMQDTQKTTLTLWDNAGILPTQKTSIVTPHPTAFVSFSHDNKTVIGASVDWRRWDTTKTPKDQGYLTSFQPITYASLGPLTSIVANRDTSKLAILGEKQVHIATFATSAQVIPHLTTLSIPSTQHISQNDIAISPNGRYIGISVSSLKSTIHLYDSTQSKWYSAKGTSDRPSFIAVSDKGALYVAEGKDISYTTTTPTGSLSLSKKTISTSEAITALALSDDGMTLTVGLEKGTLILYDALQWTQLHKKITTVANPITRFSFSPYKADRLLYIQDNNLRS